MGTFVITTPEGRKFKVTGESREGALAALKSRLAPKEPIPNYRANQAGKTSLGPEPEPQWSDLPANISSSAYNAGKGLVEGTIQAVTHPNETASAVNDILTGAENKVPGVLALKRATGWGDESQAEVARKDEIANATKDAIYNRYGTLENAKRTLIKDPVGVALDVGTVASGGSAALARVPLKAAQVASRGLGTVAAATNPLNAVVKPVAAATKAVTRSPIKELEVLRTEKNRAYGDVGKAGVVIHPRAVNGLVAAIGRGMVRDKYNPTRHEKTAAMVPTLQAMENTTPTLTELDQLRQVIYRDLAKSPDAAEAHFGNLMIKSIDKFVENLSPNMVVSGDARKAKQLLDNARKANKRYRKSEMVMEAMDRGERQAAVSGSGANVDNTTRQRANAIINDKRKFNSLSPAEKEKLRQIVDGTRAANTMRRVGKLAPTGIVSGGLGTTIGAALGGAIAGPAGGAVGAVGLPAIGQLAKLAGDSLTKGGLNDLLRMVQNDGRAVSSGSVRDPGGFNALYLLSQMQEGR